MVAWFSEDLFYLSFSGWNTNPCCETEFQPKCGLSCLAFDILIINSALWKSSLMTMRKFLIHSCYCKQHLFMVRQASKYLLLATSKETNKIFEWNKSFTWQTFFEEEEKDTDEKDCKAEDKKSLWVKLFRTWIEHSNNLGNLEKICNKSVWNIYLVKF